MPIPLGILAVTGMGGASNYFLARYAVSGYNLVAYRSKVDSAGNIYACGYYRDAGTTSTAAHLIKFTPQMTIAWEKVLDTSAFDINFRLDLDSSDNVYVVGRYNSSTYGDIAILSKWNSSGSLQWQRLWDSNYQNGRQGIATDSSGNSYWLFRDEGQGRFAVAKLNSSGTIQWRRQLAEMGSNGNEYEITEDSAGNFIASGYSTASSNQGFVQKFNSSGTQSWGKQLITSDGTKSTYIVVNTTDSSNNVYLVGTRLTATNGDQIFAIKLNSSGALQFRINLGDANQSSQVYATAVDSENNIYYAGADGNDGIFGKWNSSGTLQWQRKVSLSGETIAFFGITIDNNNDIFLSGYTSPSSLKSFIMKVPNDGSLTGTYNLDGNSYVYAASSYTAGTFTDVSVNDNFAMADSTVLIEASSATEITATSTLTKTTI